ncbi:E3 SUMO-protein ligase ZBED1-like [Haliotis asinina]|uniref:E3 SUMO-protein ligase ZBED1-like n=1 Tax=Haliotis asinina TaxID=109174 RepID=UPI00353272BE
MVDAVNELAPSDFIKPPAVFKSQVWKHFLMSKDKDMFMNTRKFPAGSIQTQMLTKALAYVIVIDLQPFSLVENDGFVKFFAALEPRYKLPNRKKTLSQKLIPELYETTKLAVLSDLATCLNIALTTDGWTSRSTQGCITITSQHISNDWKIVSYVLQTRVIQERHTGVNIGKVLKDAVLEWGTGDKQPALVTDNAANMGVAAEVADMSPHIYCFAHTFNLATQRGMKLSKVSSLLSRVRKVVRFLHRSTVAFAHLKTNQPRLDLPKTKLKMDLVTRWNSTYDMLGDVRNVEQLVEILRPLKGVTEVLCEEKTPTISIVAPMLHLIRSQMIPLEGDSGLMKDVKEAILTDLGKRYNSPKVKQILHRSSAADPRFKTLPFLNDEEKSSVFADLGTTVAEYSDRHKVPTLVKEESQDPSAINDTPLPHLPDLPNLSNTGAAGGVGLPPVKQEPVKVPKQTDSSGSLSKLFGDVYVVKMDPPPHQEQTKSSLLSAQEEIEKYVRGMPLNVDSNPLDWWKFHEHLYPMLSQFAKSILCIPVTSVPSERVFSAAGDIVTARRANISWKHVGK